MNNLWLPRIVPVLDEDEDDGKDLAFALAHGCVHEHWEVEDETFTVRERHGGLNARRSVLGSQGVTPRTDA